MDSMEQTGRKAGILFGASRLLPFLFPLLFAALLLLVSSGAAEPSWSWRRDENGFAVLTGCADGSAVLTVPQTVDGLEVIGLDPGAVPEGTQRVVLPATAAHVAEGAVPEGCEVAARHGTPALARAEALGLAVVDLSRACFTEIVADLTDADVRRTADGFSVPRALALALEEADSVAFYETSTNEAWLIEGFREDGARALVSVGELDPMLTYEHIVIESREAAADGARIDPATGNAVFEFTPGDQRFPLRTRSGLFEYTLAAEVCNFEFRMELDTIALLGPAFVAGYNLAAVINSRETVDMGSLVQSCRINCDLGFSAETASFAYPGTPDAFLSSVNELEFELPGSIQLPLKFSLNPSIMLQTIQLQVHRLESGIENIHFDLDYRYGKKGTSSLKASFSPGTPYTKTTELSSNELTLQYVLALDWMQICTVGEFTYGVTWNEQTKETELENYAGTTLCRNVSWDVYRRAQATFCPGIDFSKAFGRGRAKFYVQGENEAHIPFPGLEDGVTWGFTHGAVTSFFITKEFAKQRIDWPLNLGPGSVVQSGETDVHFERDEYGSWRRTDACARAHSITFDSGIEGDVPVTVDCSGIQDRDQWGRLNRTLFDRERVFEGWYTPDGVRFFDDVDSHVNPFDWNGNLVLTARWRDAERPPIPYHGLLPGYMHMDDGSYHIEGRELANAQAYYDSLLSPPDISRMYQLGMIDAFYLGESEASQQLRADLIRELSGFGSSALHVIRGAESGPDLTSVYYGDRVVTSTGYERSTGLQSVWCSDSMTDVGKYDGCTALTSVRLPQNAGFTALQPYAFRGCTALRHIELPSSLVSIGDAAFDQCSSLESMTYSGTLERVGQRAFAGTRLTSLSLDADEVAHTAFDEMPCLKSLTLTGDTLSFTGGSLLSGTLIESLTIDVNRFPSGLSLYCLPNLKTLTIRAPGGIGGTISVTRCGALMDLTVECGDCPGVLVDGCGLLTGFTVSNTGLLGELYLHRCSALEEATVEGTVRLSSIERCDSLAAVNLGGAQPEAGMRSTHFSGLPVIRQIDIPEGVETLEAGAVENNPSLCIVTVPANTVLEPGAIVSSGQAITVRRRTAGSFGMIEPGEGYTLTFTGPFGEEEEACTVREGATVTLAAPGRAGVSVQYNEPQSAFLGWYLNGDREHLYRAGDSFEMPARDCILLAAYEYGFAEIEIENGTLTRYRGTHLPETMPLILPEEVKRLGENSIQWNERAVWLGAGIEEAGEGAFREAKHLERIDVDPENPRYASVDGVLYTKDGTLVCVPQGYASDTLAVRYGTKALGAYSFFVWLNTPLRTLYIPDTVTDVDENWYKGAHENVISVDKYTMVYGPETGPVAESAAAAGISYNVFPVAFLRGNELIAIAFGQSGTPLGALGFAEEGFLHWSDTPSGDPVSSDFVIPFGGCSLYAVGKSAAYASMTLPRVLRAIGENAFSSISTDSVAVPETVTSIASSAFGGCPNLRRVYLPQASDRIHIADSAFEGCGNLVTLIGPEGGAAQAFAEAHPDACAWERE